MRRRSDSLMEKILEFVNDYALNNNGRTPSNREIGAELNISHVSAHRYLKTMTERGMLSYEGGEIHTDVIDKYQVDGRTMGKLNSSVPAGSPDMVDDSFVEEYYNFPAALVNGLNGKFYMMKVSGESMIDAGIDDGDYVIFKETDRAHEDDIIIAFIEGEGNTLKRYCKDKRGSFLWAENESWTDEDRNFGRKFQIRGLAIKVIKDV